MIFTFLDSGELVTCAEAQRRRLMSDVSIYERFAKPWQFDESKLGYDPGGEYIVETDGYRPVASRVEEFVRAGKFLQYQRGLGVEFPDGVVPEDYTPNPVLRLDKSDLHYVHDKTMQRLRQQELIAHTVSERSKAQAKAAAKAAARQPQADSTEGKASGSEAPQRGADEKEA